MYAYAGQWVRVEKFDPRQTRDNAGRWVSENKTKLEIAGGAAGLISGGNFARATMQARKFSNATHAAERAFKQAKDVGEQFGTADKMSEYYFRNQMPFTDPANKAAQRYAQTHGGAQKLIRQNESRKANFFSTAAQQNKALLHLVDNAPKTDRPLVRTLDLPDEVVNGLKSGDIIPPRLQSWSSTDEVSVGMVLPGSRAASKMRGTKNPWTKWKIAVDSMNPLSAIEYMDPPKGMQTVVFHMAPGDGRALNIERTSGLNQQEHLTNTALRVIRRDGNNIHVEAVEKSAASFRRQ